MSSCQSIGATAELIRRLSEGILNVAAIQQLAKKSEIDANIANRKESTRSSAAPKISIAKPSASDVEISPPGFTCTSFKLLLSDFVRAPVAFCTMADDSFVVVDAFDG